MSVDSMLNAAKDVFVEHRPLTIVSCASALAVAAAEKYFPKLSGKNWALWAPLAAPTYVSVFSNHPMQTGISTALGAAICYGSTLTKLCASESPDDSELDALVYGGILGAAISALGDGKELMAAGIAATTVTYFLAKKAFQAAHNQQPRNY